jgi:hypothetical protein
LLIDCELVPIELKWVQSGSIVEYVSCYVYIYRVVERTGPP